MAQSWTGTFEMYVWTVFFLFVSRISRDHRTNSAPKWLNELSAGSMSEARFGMLQTEYTLRSAKIIRNYGYGRAYSGALGLSKPTICLKMHQMKEDSEDLTMVRRNLVTSQMTGPLIWLHTTDVSQCYLWRHVHIRRVVWERFYEYLPSHHSRFQMVPYFGSWCMASLFTTVYINGDEADASCE